MRFGRDQVTERVRRIVTAHAVLVDVGFEHVAGTIGVVLQVRQCFEQALTAPVDEKRGQDAGFQIAQALEDGRPAGDAVHVGSSQAQAQFAVLFRHGITVAFAAEHVRARDEPGKHPALFVRVPKTIRFGAVG